MSAATFTTPAGTTYVLPADAARALDRFRPGTPPRYSVAHLADAPVLDSRAAAEYVYCAALCVPPRSRVGELRYVRWDVHPITGSNVVRLADDVSRYAVHDNACVIVTPRAR